MLLQKEMQTLKNSIWECQYNFFKIKDHMEANPNQISLQVEWPSFVAPDTRINPAHSQSVNLTNIYWETLKAWKFLEEFNKFL